MKAVQAKTRISIKNVLFTTDFSSAADAALPFAMQIARRYGAKVYGVHVNRFDDYTMAAPNAWAAMAEAREREAKEDALHLNEQLEGIEHEVMIEEGNVWAVLGKLIEEKQIDLVVVGTRGRTGIGKALLGSVAEEILRHADCAVLTVGPHVALEPAQAAKMNEILYATDMVTDFPAAAPYAISLAQENQAHLILLHVMEEGSQLNEEPQDQLAASIERNLRKLLPEEAQLWCEPQYAVRRGVPAETILQMAKSRGVDLIVLGARRAKRLTTHLDAGTVHNVVMQANCPVLTVRG